MIDTHSHIYGPEFEDDRSEVVARAKETGVEKVLLANVDLTTIEPMKQCNKDYPDFTAMAMGLHPTEVKEDWRDCLLRICNEFDCEKYVAVGEVGMDLYWDRTFEQEQKAALKEQIDWALSMDLPLILHIRKAYAETFDVLKCFGSREFRGVFHCFGGGIEEARKAIRMGFKLGIGGVVTYKNSGLPQILAEVGPERLLLETDAPYLSPVPYRGKRNEPAFMAEVRSRLGVIFGRNAQEIDEITTKNAKETFGI